MDNANHLYDGLQKLGYELSSHISPVVPVIIGSKEEGLRIWRELISLGVYVNLILPHLRVLRCCAVALTPLTAASKSIPSFRHLLP